MDRQTEKRTQTHKLIKDKRTSTDGQKEGRADGQNERRTKEDKKVGRKANRYTLHNVLKGRYRGGVRRRW